MKTNYHTHSELCDGAGHLRDYADTAVSRGFTILGFSGHAPLPFPNSWTMDEEGLQDYLGEVHQLRETYRGTLEILLGLEIDYLDEEHNPAQDVYDALGLDYRIGSVHHLYSPQQEEFLQVDYTTAELNQLLEETYRNDVEAMVTDYYRMVRAMVRTGGFDIVGHLDLIKKHNAGNAYFDEGARWYRDAVRRTLEEIAESGLIMEVNTGAMARGYTAEPYPSGWALEEAAQLGIPVVLNADAHKPEWLDYGYEEVKKMIRSSGYGSRMEYIDGTWTEVPDDGGSL